MIFHIVEVRAPNFTTNSIHIEDEEGHAICTVWEITGRGQDELWERAERILDGLNDFQRCLEILHG